MAWSDAARAAAAEVRRRHKTILISSVVTAHMVINKAKVARYVAAMKKGVKFPRIQVTKRPSGYFDLHDGHHRLQAALKAGRLKINAKVLYGNL